MFVRFHVSSQVRSLVIGSWVCRASRAGIVGGGAHHDHLVDALERHDLGLDADHGVGAGGTGFGRDPRQRQVPRRVEDVAELLDLAAAEALEAAQNPTANARGIGHVAEDELPRRIAGVQQAVEFLAVAAGGKEDLLGRVSGGMDAGGHREELDIAVERPQLAGYARDSRPAALLSLFQHAGE